MKEKTEIIESPKDSRILSITKESYSVTSTIILIVFSLLFFSIYGAKFCIETGNAFLAMLRSFGFNEVSLIPIYLIFFAFTFMYTKRSINDSSIGFTPKAIDSLINELEAELDTESIINRTEATKVAYYLLNKVSEAFLALLLSIHVFNFVKLGATWAAGVTFAALYAVCTYMDKLDLGDYIILFLVFFCTMITLPESSAAIYIAVSLYISSVIYRLIKKRERFGNILIIPYIVTPFYLWLLI